VAAWDAASTRLVRRLHHLWRAATTYGVAEAYESDDAASAAAGAHRLQAHTPRAPEPRRVGGATALPPRQAHTSNKRCDAGMSCQASAHTLKDTRTHMHTHTRTPATATTPAAGAMARHMARADAFSLHLSPLHARRCGTHIPCAPPTLPHTNTNSHGPLRPAPLPSACLLTDQAGRPPSPALPAASLPPVHVAVAEAHTHTHSVQCCPLLLPGPQRHHRTRRCRRCLRVPAHASKLTHARNIAAPQHTRALSHTLAPHPHTHTRVRVSRPGATCARRDAAAAAAAAAAARQPRAIFTRGWA
jgi:hypothetical protein